ncbi:hypothetical protein LIER_25144 [Lithospermum erythrorhizon]|uniref:X8 domain-containing protein n=1 Tax=Lithospermum erythrorhizon TaxID=34254 RepID=A0AAV3R7X6_LITER
MTTTFVCVLLFLAMVGHSSASWCVCKQGDDKTLQKTLDYACGAGADCNPLHQGGACYNPNSVKDHCDYAVNSFFQKKGQATGTCDFAGTATIATSDPSKGRCSFPASASSSTPTTNTGMNGTPSTGNSPFGSGGLGGMNNGLGPSGSSMDNENAAGVSRQKGNLFLCCMIMLVSGHMFLWA